MLMKYEIGYKVVVIDEKSPLYSSSGRVVKVRKERVGLTGSLEEPIIITYYKVKFKDPKVQQWYREKTYARGVSNIQYYEFQDHQIILDEEVAKLLYL